MSGNGYTYPSNRPLMCEVEPILSGVELVLLLQLPLFTTGFKFSVPSCFQGKGDFPEGFS